MTARETRDATFTLRVWQEPHDPVLRARLTCLPAEQTTTAVGTEQILAVVTAALRSFQADSH